MTKGEADATDPQQRLLLEVAYEAFENVGIPVSKLAGSKTSVYSSCFATDFTQISAFDTMYRSLHESTGHSSALVSNRVSWFFDLRGPSMTIDTGCSGSTVAFYLACESLRSGEAESALACGVNLILAPDPFIGMTAFNFVGEDGLSYSFDHRAQGYSRGEGFAAVMLKPLDAAVRDNDTIRAVVRSSSVAQDGRTPGLTLPSRDAQATLIRDTYKRAGLGLEQTAFVEAHGTGTIAGDAAELGAIGDVFASSRRDQKMLVGSAKTNIGHLEGCAGLAGMIKAILAVERGLVPPNLNFEKSRPENDLETYKIEIPTKLRSWPIPGVRRASVNCFGFGGTIAHIILDEPPQSTVHEADDGPNSTTDIDTHRSKRRKVDESMSTMPRLLVWSAPEQDAVLRNTKAFCEYTTLLGMPRLDDLAYTLAERRSCFSWRSFAVAKTSEEALQVLQQASLKPVQAAEGCKVCFVFTGQGAQWFGMGRELLYYTAFFECIREADAFLRSLGADWSVMETLESNHAATDLDDPERSQTLWTVLQTALVDLLDSWGVEPTVVIGHSSGDIAAAYCAGAISRHDAWRLAYFRGKACASAPAGAMISVGLSADNVEQHIATLGLEEQLDLACYNSPNNVTVSGESAAVGILESFLNEQGVFNRKLRGPVAYHSRHMTKPGKEYCSAVLDIKQTRGGVKCRMFSTVTSNEILHHDLDAEYFVRNLTLPVRFSSALQSALKECHPDFVLEIGPHAVLQSSIKVIANEGGLAVPTYSSILVRNKDAVVTALEAMGKLRSKGGKVNLSSVNSPTGTDKVHCLPNLPPYAWNHTRSYWFESQRMKASRQRKFARHDLLGEVDIGSHNLDMRWRNVISPKELPWVLDHKMQDVTLYPAAGMLVMVLEAAR